MFNILVVEDNKNTRYLMRELLEAEHYVVYTACDGEEALNLLENHHVDLAIVDVMMPKLDGYGFTSELRSFNKEMPVLMVSAKHMSEDRKRGFLSGIDDYMTKPIDNEELLLHIKALLRRAYGTGERVLRVGSVVLDYNTYTVKRGEEVHLLPQKEFQLLFKLLSHPDKIFTRIQLMDEIWGMDCETGSDTVTVHVARLRKRFEKWNEFEIENIRGLGYRAVKKA